MSEMHPAVLAFHRAAESVPAYKRLLSEAGVSPPDVQGLGEFRRLVPVTDKQSTFGRFSVPGLCRDGRIGRLAWVLTSSGHSGRFSFGLCDQDAAEEAIEQTDAALDMVFGVRSRSTLLINCLPMGVKVYTRTCTLGETSVRADVAIALVSQFGPEYDQVILVGGIAFIKHVLELGVSEGLDWAGMLVHAVVGEELVVENARKYVQGLLGIDPARPETGIVASSLGAAELGLNLFFELPPLIALRRALHDDERLRQSVLGPSAPFVPMVVTYDPRRIFVEVGDEGRLLITTLDPKRRLPLIRYATGDVASVLDNSDALSGLADSAGITMRALEGLPVLLVHGRGEFALAGGVRVYPEQVKEGLYVDASLAKLTTANFRLASGQERALLRIQLSAGVAPRKRLDEAFAEAVGRYVRAPLKVTCEAYECFGGGVALDYERKFRYLASD